jgi:hypothetical protein
MPTAATVTLSETNGPTSAPVVTNAISTLNFGSVDAPDLDPTSYPLVQRADALTFSYTKWLRVYCSAFNDSHLLTNFKMWKVSGDLKAYEYLGYSKCRSGGAYGEGVVGTGSVDPMPYNGSGAWFFSGMSASYWNTTGIPVSEPASNLFGSIAASGGFSGYAAMAVQIAGWPGSATPLGPLSQKVITYQWDES